MAKIGFGKASEPNVKASQLLKKIHSAFDVKDAEQKAKAKYPSYEVGRITMQTGDLDYYKFVKGFNGKEKKI